MTTITEEWAEWSQNLGHEDVKTTFQSYAKVPSHRQAEIFDSLMTKAGVPATGSYEPDQETVEWVLAYLQKKVS